MARVFTARKRSCRKVIFLQVSVILFTGGCLVPGWCLLRGGGLLLGGGLIRGGLVPEGAWWRPSPRRLLLRAVRILLECILVYYANVF